MEIILNYNYTVLSRHIIVSGKVQGVFFRRNARQKANELKLSGWVKNTADNNVELFVQGTKKDVENFIEWCWQGPLKAKVDNVYVEVKEANNSLKEFVIIYEDE